MRGTLEGCILKIISLHRTYGYEIVSNLQKHGLSDVKEGTVYPILMRLEKKKLISSSYLPSPLGPARKYYEITEEGRKALEEFRIIWSRVTARVGKILRLEVEI